MSVLPILLYVGLDCGSQEHYARMLTPDGETRACLSIPHSPDGFDQLIAWILERPESEGDPARVACAIESPHGPLVETLLAHGFEVFAINPKQLDRFRDRHTPSGAKDDSRDALVLADSLRTDRRHFQRVEPEAEEIMALREHYRMRRALKSQEVRLANQIRDRLRGYFPQILTLASSMTDPLLRAVLKRWPTPEKAARCSLQSIAKLIRELHIRRISAEKVHALLRSATPCGSAVRGRAEATFLLMELEQLELLHTQRAKLEALAKSEVEAFRERCQSEQDDPSEPDDVAILASLPGVGPVLLCALLAEGARGVRERDVELLRTHGGIAPVTRQSGKQRQVVMRRACNGYLRDALHQWGQAALSADPRAKRHYRRLRDRGHSHGRALRGVADTLLRLAIAMLQSRTLFDAERWHSTRAA